MGKRIGWNFWIDCGGTFTDIVALSRDGEHRVHKLLSKSPHYNSPVVQGVKDILGNDFSLDSVEKIRLGTTVATNAFLEKNGIDCALVTTLGFRDLLEIRRQNRPRLFDLDIKKVENLYKEVAHIKERLDSEGRVLVALDEEIVRFELERMYGHGLRSVAVALMHSPTNPKHELRVGEIAKEVGFEFVSLSHQVSPVSKYVYRAQTCVAEAYLTPLLDIYTKELAKEFEGVEIVYMQSNGGLCKASDLKGQNALLSGPAGGLIGAVESGKRRGVKKLITFDMGGTSTDVAIFDGEIHLHREPEFLGHKLLAPMMDIHTVAAGGGSILKFDGGRFSVGPESAGAFPGPACYRNGGPLTVTDANLFLGRLEASQFPKIFGPNRDQALDEEVVKEKFSDLAKVAGMSPEEVALGFLDVAANTMARAIKKVSVERGQDPKEFAMVSFGGAAGQMACKVADAIGIKSIFIHPLSSVLSAYGIGLANESYEAMMAYPAPCQSGRDENLKELFSKLHFEIKEKLPGARALKDQIHMRAIGGDYEISVKGPEVAPALKEFENKYKKLFGLEFQGGAEIVALSSSGIKESGNTKELFSAEGLGELKGPALLSANNTCIVIDPGWSGSKNEYGEWILKKTGAANKLVHDKKIELEIFYQRFQSIADQMGHVLQSLAHSITIKERNDFSCALFTAKGELLANAPHIPVHLGSMGDAVKAVAAKFEGEIAEGDGYVCNDPNFGGTHLPDITIVTPIYLNGELAMWAASRGHHGDIGGISPGSMPGSSSTLEQEGVVIPPIKTVSKGKLMVEELREILDDHPYPARNPDQNIHDIRAQLAANEKARSELEDLSKECGVEKIARMAEAILSYSAEKIKSVLEGFTTGEASLEVAPMRKIALKMDNDGNRLRLDFGGSSPAGEHNFNTPLPVVKASVLFALRCLIEEDIPLNDGIARYLDIKTPKNSLLNPGTQNAVVAGNVETSQVLCDLIFEALKVKAHSQGTMNNLSFGNENFQYYETLGGGSGASSQARGASAVQVNMTNSLLTDPEVMEHRLPVRIGLMAVRRGSGGTGQFNGGDGIYRRLLFLEDCFVSMISQRRLTSPKGIAGGGPGLRGANLKESVDGEISALPECFQDRIQKGERLMISTPGGGGFGKTPERNSILVYGFGSNMDGFQIKKRCPSSQFLCRAKLIDHELRYTIYSDMRKGGVADMYHAPGKAMWGAVYSMNERDLAVLDEIECGKGHYSRVERSVFDDDGRELKVFCYDVNDKDPDVAPTNIYRWLVYSGAYMLGAPEEYLRQI